MSIKELSFKDTEVPIVNAICPGTKSAGVFVHSYHRSFVLNLEKNFSDDTNFTAFLSNCNSKIRYVFLTKTINLPNTKKIKVKDGVFYDCRTFKTA